MYADSGRYSVIIVGAGSAGCSAAIYATRYNLKTLLLGGPMPGGLITEAAEVENYPGFLSINGQELAQKFIDQAAKLGADYKVETVKNILRQDNEFVVETSQEKYKTDAVILAAGTTHRKLNVSGEEEFTGRGVSYCVTCDGPFFKDKVVVVVGGGNSAVEGAQDMSKRASKVYIIYRSKLKAAPLYIDQMRQNRRVTEIPNSNVVKINGDNVVKSVTLDKAFQGKNTLEVDGVFVQIGYRPQNDLVKKLGVDLDDYGYIKVDVGMGTSIKGVFCAGDLNNASNYLHQQVTSAAEGAIAAQSVYRRLQGFDYIVKV